MNIITVSILIPVYNSAKIFPSLYHRIINSISETDYNLEIIAVVDGNKDNSFGVISEISKVDKRVKAICMSRNFGQQMALRAGIKHASGSIIVCIDDDLEDPPEVIPLMLEKLSQGFDVVYGIRENRKVSIFKKFLYHSFYRILNYLSEINFPNDAGDFCAMRKQVADAILLSNENNPYLRGIRAWVGFNQTGIKYNREERFDGKSGFNLTKYFKFATDAICSFSTKPLTYVSIIGLIMAVISFFMSCWVFISKVFHLSEGIPGFAFTAISILFIGSIQILSIGILGQYLSRIYDEVKKRPPYIIKERIGFD